MQTHHFAVVCASLLWRAPDALAVYTACVYIWGGIHKLNVRFMERGAIEFFGPVLQHLFDIDTMLWDPRPTAVSQLHLFNPVIMSYTFNPDIMPFSDPN